MRTPRPIAAALCGALAVVLVWAGTSGPLENAGHGIARSFLRIRPAAATAEGAGLTPTDIASAYALSGGVSGTVAIVTAYSDPHLEGDLADYRGTFGLDPCTSANGCLTVVGQAGTTALPEADVSWGEETSLDVDAVSAACPNCHVLVVEARSASIGDLGAAVNAAVRLGANAVSASWGGTEGSDWSTDATRYFTHPGVPLVAATGDDGVGAPAVPAALPDVLAVGGTTLTSTASAGGAAPLAVHDLDGGTVTSATTSATIASDKHVLAKAKAALAATKTRLATTRSSLHRAKVRRTHAVSAHAVLHWKHRIRDLTKEVTAVVKSEQAAAKRVSAAEAALLKDVLRDSSARAAAAARIGQPDRTSWIETAWSGGGSGCSSFVPRPAWQPATTCARRGTADLAADADPQTGLATYDTFGTSRDAEDGWMIAGGTSLASPLVAAMIVRSGHASSYSSAGPLYGRAGAFWDITGGSNGACRTSLCAAGVGYDGPTGLGSPRSLASF